MTKIEMTFLLKPNPTVHPPKKKRKCYTASNLLGRYKYIKRMQIYQEKSHGFTWPFI